MTSSSTDPTPVEDDKELLMGDAVEEDEADEDDDEEEDAPTDYPRSLPMPPCSGHQYHLTSLQRSNLSYAHMWLIVFTVIVVTGTAVTFPPYLDAINAKSDAYCSLFFSSLCTLLLLICAATFTKIRSRDWSFQPPIAWNKVVQLGVYLGLSGLAVFYARDRNRVLCHLQDPLAASVLPMAVVCHFFFSSKVDNTRKLFCLAAIIIGLFVCIDFQIWDEFSCHGHASNEMFEEVRQWTSEENAIWTIVYIGGLALFAMFVTVLEREMKGDKPECLVATIALTPTSPITPMYPDAVSDDLNEVLIQQSNTLHHPTKQTTPYMRRGKASELFHKNQVLSLAMWIQFVSFCTILGCSWTDLFSFLGKAGSTNAFNTMLRSGILCHYSGAADCGGVASAAWPFIFFSTLLLVAILFLVNYSGTCSAPYMVAIITTALPLSAFCWSFFKTDGGFHWDPSFTGETGFTLVGLPIMAIALGFYRYYAIKELNKV